MMRLGSFGDVGLWDVLSDSTRGELRLGPGKPLALLVYLAAAPGRRSSREHLIEMLWSDRPVEEARHVLRQVTWQLRRRLGDVVLATVGEDLILSDQIESDRTQFLLAIEEGRLDEALAVYRGEFLPAFATPGATGFERWADLERMRLRAVFLRAAETVARRLLAAGQPRAAVSVARRARDADRLSTSAWRLLLEALASAGDTLGAITEADALEETFRAEELEIDAVTSGAVRIARRLPSDMPADEMTRAQLVTDLIGRERDFSCILQAWDRARQGGGAQCVHLVGEAGIGKTRLVSDVLARFRASRVRAAYVRAYPNHETLPFGLAGDIVAVIGALPGAVGVSPAVAASLVALAPSLSGKFPAAVPETFAHDDLVRRRYMAVHELLVAVCDDAPVALVIDDLHWADEASRAVILAVLDRLSTERLVVVTTSRPALDAMDPRGLSVQLSALSEEGVEALVTSLGELPELPWAEGFAAVLRRATAGVPLLILETLQDSLDQGLLVRNGRAWSAPRPDGLLSALLTGVALQQRLERLGAEARAVLLHLAIAGGPTPMSRLTRSLRFAGDALAAQIEMLQRIGLVKKTAEGLEIAHDSFADVLVATAGADDVRAAHAACGVALADEPEARFADIIRAARHLEAAGETRALPRLLERAALLQRRVGDRRSPRALAHEIVREVLGPEAKAERSALLEHDLRQRLTRRRRQLLAASTLAVLSLGTWAAGRILAAPPGRPVASVMVSWEYPFDDRVLQLDLTREMFAGHGGKPIPARPLGRPHDEYRVSSFYVSDRLVENPARGEWASASLGPVYSRLVLTRGGEATEFVVRHLGYLRDPSWSPDGAALVFSRERYDGPGYELAVVERLSKRVRSLASVSTDTLVLHFSTDRTPLWGPDGTRIAFVRAKADSEPGALCWTTPDGTSLSCSTTSTSVWAVRAWRDPSHVLVESVSGQRHDLSEIQIDNGRVRVLESDVGEANVSPDGQWVARFCRKPVCGPNGWLIGPVGLPRSARPVVMSPPPAAVKRYADEVRAGRVVPSNLTSRMRLFWRAPAAAAPYVAMAGVRMDGLGPGETLSFTAHWLDQHGRPIQPSVSAAYATEPDVAALDSTGRVRWRRPLSAGRFVFSAGGWRADTAVMIGPDSVGNRAAPADMRRIIREALKRWSEAPRRGER